MFCAVALVCNMLAYTWPGDLKYTKQLYYL